MRIWECRLTPQSQDELLRLTGLKEVNPCIQIKAEFDTPASYVRTRALDSLSLLVQQERPGMAPEELGDLAARMVIDCQEVGREAGRDQQSGSRD